MGPGDDRHVRRQSCRDDLCKRLGAWLCRWREYRQRDPVCARPSATSMK